MDCFKIINKNVIKIIDALRKGELYFNQIYELTGIMSKNNIVKNLDFLTELKVIKKKKNKSNTFYSINYENDISLVLLQMLNMFRLQNLPFERRKAITEVLSLAKPCLAVLFGSTAKNNFKKKSDIDVLLISSKSSSSLNKKIAVISSRYGLSINPILMDFDEFNVGNETVRHIIKTGYPLVGYRYFYEVLKNV